MDSTSSRIGERTYTGTLAFLSLIHSPMLGYSLILPQGGHNFRTWNRELPQSLEWLSHRLTPALSADSSGATGRQLARAARNLASVAEPARSTQQAGLRAQEHRGSLPHGRQRLPGQRPEPRRAGPS